LSSASVPELRAWLALLRVPALGPQRGRRLLSAHGGPEAVLAAGPAAWRGAGLNDAACKSLPAVVGAAAALAAGAPADPLQVKVLDALGFETVALDTLVERLGLPVGQVGAALLALELEGRVAAGPGDTFMRLQRVGSR
jgi:predicted Rossmann fold nucleotide-binding protein DprA/Smf involved in DNA uptake